MNSLTNDASCFPSESLEALKVLSQQWSIIDNPSAEMRCWLAQYAVLVNQLKSRNVHGTVAQLQIVSEQLLLEAHSIHSLYSGKVNIDKQP